jgi:processive 1,2-diacylglycerol beta-glucosyltransferase
LFFTKKGAAITIGNQEELVTTINSLLENREWQFAIGTSLKKLHQPHSHKIIMDDILRESDKIAQSNIATIKTVNKKLGS